MAEVTERQEARAVARFIRIAPRKARVVADLVRGLDLNEARAILQFTNKRGARLISKVVESAAANATNNFDLDEDYLYVSEIYVDEGPTMKRWKPRARGMASPILKRTSHITVVVREREEV